MYALCVFGQSPEQNILISIMRGKQSANLDSICLVANSLTRALLLCSSLSGSPKRLTPGGQKQCASELGPQSDFCVPLTSSQRLKGMPSSEKPPCLDTSGQAPCLPQSHLPFFSLWQVNNMGQVGQHEISFVDDQLGQKRQQHLTDPAGTRNPALCDLFGV